MVMTKAEFFAAAVNASYVTATGYAVAALFTLCVAVGAACWARVEFTDTRETSIDVPSHAARGVMLVVVAVMFTAVTLQNAYDGLEHTVNAELHAADFLRPRK